MRRDMVIQYIIDWQYVSRVAFVREHGAILPDDTSRVELLVERLRAVKDHVCLNGLMPVDKKHTWTRSLQVLARRVSSVWQECSGENTLGAKDQNAWRALSLVLEAFRDNVYQQRALLIETPAAANVKECVHQSRQYLARQGLRKVRTIVLSDAVNDDALNFEYVLLDDYWRSETAALREKWEHNVSFSPGSEESFSEYLAGIMLSALPSRTVALYDPYWSMKLFSGANGSDGRWLKAAQAFVSVFSAIPVVKNIVFVSEEPDGDEGVDWNARLSGTMAALRFNDFQRAVTSVVERARISTADVLHVGVRLRRKSRDFHNRYIETGMACCLVPDGLDVLCFDERHAVGFKIVKAFECCLWNTKSSVELAEVKKVSTLYSRSKVKIDQSRGLVPVPQNPLDVTTFVLRGKKGVVG